MKAKALIARDDKTFGIEEIVLADLGPEDVLVRTVCSGVSIGTEFALIKNKISWGPFPLCTGYQAAGIVEETGKGITRFKPGDRVFLRSNKAPFALADGTPVSCSGTHASRIICPVGEDPVDGLVPIPDGVDMGAASMTVMPSVALRGIEMARVSSGEAVAVYGVGQIGLGVVAHLALRGNRIVALDVSDRNLELARLLGADETLNVSEPRWRERFDALLPDGADAVFEATGIPECIDRAMELVRRSPFEEIDGQGKFIFQGNYGAAPITHSFLTPHMRNLRAYYPCDDGKVPNRRTVLRLMERGVLNWERVISHRIPYAEAPRIYREIARGSREYNSVVINWDEGERA